ncbi:GFA family protein [Patescibacteria group bacterium]|nr:GFA family protein [Patescibacteria group bacterium]
MKEKTGACVCGNVTYSITGEYTGVVSCHCKSCQRYHGNYNPMIVANVEDVALKGDISWFASSESAERGFCAACGSALFKRQTAGPKLLVLIPWRQVV